MPLWILKMLMTASNNTLADMPSSLLVISLPLSMLSSPWLKLCTLVTPALLMNFTVMSMFSLMNLLRINSTTPNKFILMMTISTTSVKTQIHSVLSIKTMTVPVASLDLGSSQVPLNGLSSRLMDLKKIVTLMVKMLILATLLLKLVSAKMEDTLMVKHLIIGEEPPVIMLAQVIFIPMTILIASNTIQVFMPRELLMVWNTLFQLLISLLTSGTLTVLTVILCQLMSALKSLLMQLILPIMNVIILGLSLV